MRRISCLLVALLLVQLAHAAYWKDVTSTYLTNASLVSTDGWTITNYNDTSYPGAWECYAGYGTLERTSGDMHQSVTLPAGSYRLTGYAFYRYGASYSDNSSYSTGYMYAGTDTSTVAALGSITLDSYADGTSTAYTAFYTNGYYGDTLTFELTEESTINIGYCCTHDAAYSWFICGAMGLYLSSSNSEAYDELAELIEICEGYYNNSEDITDGARSTLYSAISTAKSALSSSSSDDDLTSAYETLEAAREDFVKAAYPTNGTTFDMTFLITNNSFETGDLTGWTYTSGYDTGARSTSNTTYVMGKSDGDYLFNTWSSESMDFILEGIIASLPEGIYKLTSVLASDDDNTITLYAGAYSTEVTTTGKYNGIESEVEFYQTTDGINFGTTSTTWYKADNFQLFMTGSLESLKALYSSIDQDSLNTAVKDSLNSAYTNFVSALSSSSAEAEYASSYSPTYTIDANGNDVTPTDNSTTITVSSNSDGTYNLAMGNVKLAVTISSYGTDTITISNISLSNITGYNVNGMLYLDYSGDLTVSLSDTGIKLVLITYNLVNSSATLPITLSLRMNEENIYGNVVITDLDDAISSTISKLGSLASFDIDDYEPATITFGSYFRQESSTDALSEAITNYEDALALCEDYIDFLQFIAATEAMTTVNVGTSAFQIPQSAVTTLQTAITAAESDTIVDVAAAATALQTAIDTYEAAELNAPGENEHIKITANTEGFTYNGKPVTFYYNSSTSGYYALTWALAASNNYAQAFSFHEVTDSTNVYTISFTDSLGTEHYLCSNLTGYSEGTYWQIRTTEAESAALKVKVIVSHETEGLWYLSNTEADDYLGSNGDAGFFTSSNYYGLALSTASQASVTLSISSASNYYATLILPFKATIPDDLEVYEITSTKATDDTGVTTLVYTQVKSIAANTPYLVYASKEADFSYTFADYGVAAQDQFADTYMSGTLVSMTAIAGTYVLQKQDDYGLAFYVVNNTKPTVGAYRAYVNALSSSSDEEANIRVVLISSGEEEEEDDATAISGVQTTDSESPVRVYSLSGVLVSDGLSESEAMQSLPQGIYIINGTKRLVR